MFLSLQEYNRLQEAACWNGAVKEFLRTQNKEVLNQYLHYFNRCYPGGVALYHRRVVEITHMLVNQGKMFLAMAFITPKCSSTAYFAWHSVVVLKLIEKAQGDPCLECAKATYQLARYFYRSPLQRYNQLSYSAGLGEAYQHHTTVVGEKLNCLETVIFAREELERKKDERVREHLLFSLGDLIGQEGLADSLDEL